MRIREGDPLEIFTDAGGEVVFKKYSPIGELSSFSNQYAESLSKGTNLSVLICDRDHCIAASNIPKKEVLERRITPALEQTMESRKSFNDCNKKMSVLEGVDRDACIAVPIIAAGDVTGAVVMLSNDKCSTASESDFKLAQVAASFLGQQTE